MCAGKGWFWSVRNSQYTQKGWNKNFIEALEKNLFKKKELPEDYVWQFGEKEGQHINAPISSNEPNFKEWVQNKIHTDYLDVVHEHVAKAHETGRPRDL